MTMPNPMRRLPPTQLRSEACPDASFPTQLRRARLQHRRFDQRWTARNRRKRLRKRDPRSGVTTSDSKTPQLCETVHRAIGLNARSVMETHPRQHWSARLHRLLAHMNATLTTWTRRDDGGPDPRSAGAGSRSVSEPPWRDAPSSRMSSCSTALDADVRRRAGAARGRPSATTFWGASSGPRCRGWLSCPWASASSPGSSEARWPRRVSNVACRVSGSRARPSCTAGASASWPSRRTAATWRPMSPSRFCPSQRSCLLGSLPRGWESPAASGQSCALCGRACASGRTAKATSRYPLQRLDDRTREQGVPRVQRGPGVQGTSPPTLRIGGIRRRPRDSRRPYCAHGPRGLNSPQKVKACAPSSRSSVQPPWPTCGVRVRRHSHRRIEPVTGREGSTPSPIRPGRSPNLSRRVTPAPRAPLPTPPVGRARTLPASPAPERGRPPRVPAISRFGGTAPQPRAEDASRCRAGRS